MKKQMSILILCMLLMTPLGLAQTTKPVQPKATSADVPVWSVGDFWTYRIDNLTVNINQENFTLFVYLAMADFTMKVIAETADAYQVQLNPAAIQGNFKLYTDLGDGPINVSGSLSKTNLQGTMSISKADIGVSAINLVLKGKLIAHIYQQPYIPNLPNRFTFGFTMKVDLAFDTPYTTLSFPMDIGNIWGLPASKITVSGTIDSPWFKVINFLNNFARRWGLIPMIADKLGMTVEEAQNLSNILVDILPTVDIAHVLNEYGGGNSFNITATQDLFGCVGLENVTVPAGTYQAYNISAFGGLGYVYYAPQAGHVIKTEGQFANLSADLFSNMKMELVQTNYTP